MIPLTFTKAMDKFSLHCQYEKNLSGKTLKFYRIDLLQFRNFMEIQNVPDEIALIDKNHLKGYLIQLSQWKPKTIKRKIATLKAFFNFLEFEDHININPFRKLKIKLKEPLILPKALTLQETNTLLQTT